MRIQNVLPATALLALLGACGGEDMANPQANSTLNVAITDAPLTSATKVWLQFTGMEIKPLGGQAQSFAFSPESATSELASEALRN